MEKVNRGLMPRIRYLKHDFFLDEKLAQQSHAGRLLFAGLWVLADRDGRLEDRPMKIKAQIFPYEDVEVDHLLEYLACGFIQRYEVEGRKYIQINNFLKHQKPHQNERSEGFPPPTPVISSNYQKLPVGMGNGEGNGNGDGIKTFAPSPSASEPTATKQAVVVLSFPTTGKGPKEWGLTEEKLDEYKAAFPGLDPLGEFRRARQWCVDNPTRRKTARGMPSFLTRWLGSAQNRGGGYVSSQSNRVVGHAEPKPNKYRDAGLG